MNTKRINKTNEKGLARKKLILEQAAHLFLEKGYMASTLRDLAKRSGVKGGSIYHHFASKQEILFQIMDQTMNNLINQLKRRIQLLDDPLEKLKAAVEFHIEYHVVDANETNLADGELRSLEPDNYQKIVDKRNQYEAIFIRILEEGVREGVMHFTHTDLACKAIIQMCTGVSLWFRSDGPLKLDEITNIIFDDLCWGALGKRKLN